MFYKDSLDIDVPDYAELYRDEFDPADVSSAITEGSIRNWEKIDEPEFGCVVTFRILGHHCHCGIVIDVNKLDFIHAFRGTSVCLESLRDLTWNKRVGSFYRWKR